MGNTVTHNDYTKQQIEKYFKIIGLQPIIMDSFKQIPLLMERKKNERIIISDKRYLRWIGHLFGNECDSKENATRKASINLAMIDAIKSLSGNGVPVFFINRIDYDENISYADSAKVRMAQHRDFPTMIQKQEKYADDFHELLGEKYAIDYVKNLGNISQVIKKGSSYEHEDERSPLVNIIAGKRVTPGQPDYAEKTIHVYGRCGAFGYAVEDLDTIPAQLQNCFNENGYSFSVINHGLWGAEDEQIISNFLHDAKRFSKNDVVLFYQVHYEFSIMKCLEECGMWYKEINKEFYKYPESRWCFYDSPGHLNRDGYRIVAGIIYHYLVDSGFSARSVEIASEETKDWDIFLDSVNQSGFNEEIRKYIDSIKERYPVTDSIRTCGGIVMNCNPFTYGHRHLVEFASKQVDRLYIFVVEEDKSYFKFEDRFQMVRDGVKDIENSIVIPSGKFMISALTFPQYFMKDYVKEKNFDVSGDLEIFCKEIAPSLGITKRFAGEEPTDPVTAHYNEEMHKILPTYGIEFVEIPRLMIDDTKIVNATTVRKLINDGDSMILKDYIPDSTYKVIMDKYWNH